VADILWHEPITFWDSAPAAAIKPAVKPVASKRTAAAH